MFWRLFIFCEHSTREPASSRMTYFIVGAYAGTGFPQLAREKLVRGFGKNADKWTRRLDISKEDIPGSKHSMLDRLQDLKGEPLSYVFSSDGTLISASAAPHCGKKKKKKKKKQRRQSLTGYQCATTIQPQRVIYRRKSGHQITRKIVAHNATTDTTKRYYTVRVARLQEIFEPRNTIYSL